MTLISINPDYRPTGGEVCPVYVLKCGDGISCLGFDVCKDRSLALREWLLKHNHQSYSAEEIVRDRGTERGFDMYQVMLTVAEEICSMSNTRCDIELTPQLLGLERKRVEVVDRYGETRRFWVGKSTGWMPCHLELDGPHSRGGFGVFGAPFKSVAVIRR